MDERDSLRDRLKAYFRMLAVHDPIRGNELVDVLDAYLDAKFKREWQGLTDEEIDETAWPYFIGNIMPSVKLIVRKLEAKLKEKNT